MDFMALAAAKAYTNKKIEESGSSSLVAGDLLEIKDGVIRSTLGDLKSGELKEEIDEVFGLDSIPEMDSYGDPVVYEYYTESINKFLKLNETLTVEFTKLDGTKKTFDMIMDGFDDGREKMFYAYYNCEEIETEKDTILQKLDENLDAMLIYFYYYLPSDGNEEKELMIKTFEDFTGASLSMSYKTIIDTREYVLLPETALGLGRENTKEIEKKIVDIKEAEMNFEDGFGLISFDVNSLPEGGAILEATIKLPSQSEPVTLIAKNDDMFIDGHLVGWLACFNAIVDLDTGAITPIDENNLAFAIQSAYNDGDIDSPIMILFSASDFNGASIQINSKKVIKTNLKVPNEALNFDSKPTEGSTNLVNSGDLFNILGDIKTVISQISALVGGAS